ncbi:MAG: hypothetical protein JWM12_2545 [Ilumatobacteraceae bacterium]|nr:hypothetical protein [Ilumatobacteraceae bacterium]
MSRNLMLRGSHWRRALVGTAVAVMVGGSAASVMASASPSTRRPQGIVTATQVEVFVSVAPSRILDTRGASSGGPVGVATPRPLQPGEQLDLTVAGAGHVIPAGATAAVLNTTIDYDATLHSFLTIWPTGQPRPISSTNNALPGSEVSNLTVARLGTGGAISIFNQQGQVNLVLDVVGYLVPLNQVNGFENGVNTVLHGTGAPSDATGNDGDFYVDTTTHQFYGPKSGGHWQTPPTSLVGPQGSPGGLVAARSAYNNGGAITLAVTGFTPFDFPTDGAILGTNVARTAATTNSFTLAAAGTYQVSYRISGGTLGAGANVVVQQSGNPVGPPNTLATVGAPATDTLLVTASAGTTIQIGGNGIVQIAAPYTADIVIEQIA